MNNNNLVGKKVLELLMDPNGDVLFFKTDEDMGVKFAVDGDCCSCSYFHEIDGVDNLLGQVVNSCEEIPLPDSLATSLDTNYNPKYKDSIAYYGIEIKTDKGTTRIIYRNESNGYYGGWYSCLGEVDLPPSGLITITKDGDLYKENCDG